MRCWRRLKEEMEGAITVSTEKEFQIGKTRLAEICFLMLSCVNGIIMILMISSN